VPPAFDRLETALAGRYAIQREIGAGGMALVYLAEDLKHRREVAIKVLKPELSATIGSERFLREIEIAARLSHPHILPLFDSGAAGDVLYYVMPFVSGESLRSRLGRERHLPLDDALRLTREVASAIGFAHQHGIVHRDIKPENILLADGIALVADFGIARALRSSRGNGDSSTTALTAVGLALGTPAYMSPEQFTADEVDARSDIYSLGCVLFEMLAGQPPFVGPSLESLFRMHLTSEPRSLAELRPTVSLTVARIVARALAKDPSARFPTAATFAEAIATAVSGGIVTPTGPDAKSDTPNNLPRQRTRFIGRDRELAECARLLGETRLLTLTGIGGSGKTRIALRLAEIMLPTFPDGVWFIDFAPLVDADRVTAAAAAALGVKESADTPAIAAIRTALAGKRSLIVLDKCEHLLGPVADLADTLLTLDDGIRIVATSREGLGLDGERLLAVRSMSVSTDVKDLRALEDSDAVKFFVDRAQAARRDFALGPDNAAAIADICRRLDGIPLAIELAAARVKALSVEQIRSRLDDRFKLLTGGRSAVPRQQTLLATIQWSYDQLSPEEQELLRTLSVFSGGWTLEAATAVTGAGADEFVVLDLLTRLIDKSLVLVDQAGGAARYGMLETVRQYGLERLVESGAADDVRDRHAAVFTQLAEQFYAHKFTEEELWGGRLTKEMDNLRASLFFLRDRDSERYLDLVGALGYFWWGRSHIIEGRGHINAVMAMVSPHPVRRSYLRALRGQGMLWAYVSGGQDDARELMLRVLAMSRELGDPLEIAASLETLGWSQFLANEEEDSCATFRELRRIVEECSDPVLVNRANLGLGQALIALSRIDEARPIAREIIAFSQRAADRRSEHLGFHYLADAALIEGNPAESLPLYGQSLVLAEAIGDRIETSFEVEGIGMSLAALGEHATAIRLIAAMRAEWARVGVSVQVDFWEALIDRYITPARTALGSARTEAAVSAGREMSFDAAVAEARSLAQRPAR
jgi:non-specific serine/threonine protein kinase